MKTMRGTMKYRMLFFVLGVGMLAGIAAAETYLFTPAISKRKMKVVRKYDIIVQPDQTNVVEIPAMFSFTGATNEQTIESSVFTFSIPPNEKSIVCHELSVPRKMYQLVWKKPAAIGITITQEMVVSMTARNKLCTQAKLPYPAAVREKFAYYLGKSEDGDINPENPVLVPVCKDIVSRCQYAEQVVCGVCDWVADNIERFKGKTYGADEALTSKRGNSYALADVACSMLRKIGIPCSEMSSKYVEGATNFGYGFIEVYFPDAGWVFYDVAFPERGFKSLDSLIAAGWAYRVQNDSKKKFEWVDGFFCDEWDVMKYQEPQPVLKKAISNTPAKEDALSVMVMHGPVPKGLPIRQEPLRNLILDPNTLPPPIVEKKVGDKSGAFAGDRPKNKVRKEKD
jgi:hypothetical protein